MKENGGEGREMGEVCTVQDVGRQFMRRRREDSRQLPQRNHRILPTIDQFAGYHRSSINHLFHLSENSEYGTIQFCKPSKTTVTERDIGRDIDRLADGL